VDTSGLAPWEGLESVAAFTDLFLYDIKHMDDETHRRFTGVSNAQILTNLRRLGAIHRRIWVRVPVIPGVNDSAENLEAIGRLAAGIEGVEKVSLLPYHPLGEDKLRRQGKGSILGEAGRPTDIQMQYLLNVVEAAGVSAGLGG
jgi:pyruvate formate lyase activating enzyme